MNTNTDNEIPETFSKFLYIAAKSLSTWLKNNFSALDEEWWNSLVLPALTYQQKQLVARNRISSLEGLDLAALLRILDQNWYQISQFFKFSNQDRHYVKEMQTIRNRWSHINTQDFDSDDVYRDIDTLQRFLYLIEENDEIILNIKEFKKAIISSSFHSYNTLIEKKEEKIIANNDYAIKKKTETGSISIGSIVALNSDPNRQGAVIEIDGQSLDSRCRIFIDGKLQQFYISQIHLVVEDDSKKIVSLSELHGLLTCLQIKHPSLSTLYSLNAARIDFVPYQFRPALKIIRSDQPRLLIADGVGVGKTIEAGLVLRELQARNNITSVLIICPKPLVTERKWELEMKRFDEKFTHLDGKGLRLCIEESDLEGEWPEQHKKTIIPFSLLDEILLHGKSKGKSRSKGLLSLDPPPHFDLVIVDEAHHIRNNLTFSHQAVKYFCDNAEAVIFLTATPIQLGNQDLYTLLNLLRPDLIIDQEAFTHMSEPNPHINEALKITRTGIEDWNKHVLEALNTAGNTSWGLKMLRANPVFNEVCNTLTKDNLTREDRVPLIRKIEEFHTFSKLINRTRRRDIDNFCIRKTETIEVCFSDAQKKLHDQLLRFEANTLSKLHDTNNVNFMMSTIRRQASSCIFGLAPLINQILQRRLIGLEGLYGTEEEMPEQDIIESLQVEALDIVNLANMLPSNDPKFDAFLQIIKDKQKLINNKIMVFSTFRHTLSYLEKKLQFNNVRVGLIHGGVKDEDRLRLRSYFELPKEDQNAIDVLLFSEVGCEGLDYQFCDAMINYDLPWNPMRIEQRIGRIDRRGQKSDVVVIYNLITPNTVDADIYSRCLLRIGIFEKSIGDCEEILGDIHREIKNIAENLNLTDDDRREKFKQLADNEIRLIHEQRNLEDREHELFGLKLPGNNPDSEIRESESYWLTQASIQRFVTQYLNHRLGQGDYILGEKNSKTLRLSLDARNELLADFRKLPSNKSPMNRTWEKWLKGSDQHCNITFDSSCAADQREVQFIMPLHPLVMQSALFLGSAEPVYTVFKIHDAEQNKGEYIFAIYAWEYKGIRTELKLLPVCENKYLQENFFDYLESGVCSVANKILPENDIFDSLDKVHHELWLKEKKNHHLKTKEICAFRRESLETSHRGRISIISNQLTSVTNDKIRRMKQAQLNNTQDEYSRKIKELQKAENISDIYARPVVFGLILVEGKNDH